MKKRYLFAAGFVAFSLVLVQQNFGSATKKKEKVVTAEKKFIDKAEDFLKVMRNMHLEQIVPLLFSEEAKEVWSKDTIYDSNIKDNLIKKNIKDTKKFSFVFDSMNKTIKEQAKNIKNMFQPEEIYITGRLLKWSKRAVAYPLLGAAGFWGTKKLLSSKYFASKDDVTSIDSSLSAKAVVGAFTLPLAAFAVDYFTSGKEKTENEKAKALLNKLVRIKMFMKDFLPIMLDPVIDGILDKYPNKDTGSIKTIKKDKKALETLSLSNLEFRKEKVSFAEEMVKKENQIEDNKIKLKSKEEEYELLIESQKEKQKETEKFIKKNTEEKEDLDEKVNELQKEIEIEKGKNRTLLDQIKELKTETTD